MYTRCSYCQVAYVVSPEVLAQGRGCLHCVACRHDFDALEWLTRELPEGEHAFKARPPAAAPAFGDGKETASSGWLEAAFPGIAQNPPAPPAPSDVLNEALSAHSDLIQTQPGKGSPAPAPPPTASTMPLSAPGFHFATATATAGADTAPPPAAAPAAAAAPMPEQAPDSDANDPFHPIIANHPPAPGPTPGFIPEPEPRRSRLRPWLPWLAVLLLSLLLAAQSIHAERERLAAHAAWRPWLERLCALTGCRLPPWHDPKALRLMARDVRPHPSVPAALLISASFRNEAPWAQPWPELELSLADLDGHAIARRRFPPQEYLGIAAAPHALIQPGQTASVVLEVRDPGKQAVAFEFEFH